jgi:hypothetical protein
MGFRYLRTYKRFIARCSSRRDRETVARLLKECCYLDCDFKSAEFYRDRQRDNAPRRRAIAPREAGAVAPSLHADVGRQNQEET